MADFPTIFEWIERFDFLRGLPAAYVIAIMAIVLLVVRDWRVSVFALLVQYLARYSAEQARRHQVLPGMTGWAQVNGRNAITWEDKFNLDVWYVDHCSLSLDLKILGLTLLKVIRREGISQPGHATAEEFMGSPDSIE